MSFTDWPGVGPIPDAEPEGFREEQVEAERQRQIDEKEAAEQRSAEQKAFYSGAEPEEPPVAEQTDTDPYGSTTPPTEEPEPTEEPTDPPYGDTPDEPQSEDPTAPGYVAPAEQPTPTQEPPVTTGYEPTLAEPTPTEEPPSTTYR